MDERKGVLSIVGIGPGSAPHTSPAALEAITSADVVVGYITYIKLVRHLTEGKEIIRTGMTEEIGRARAAVERARDGAKVAIISSGDAGVYGMAGPVFQVLQEMGWKRGDSRPRLLRDLAVGSPHALARHREAARRGRRGGLRDLALQPRERAAHAAD